MKLIIAEKPELGRAIADAIPGTGQEANGVISKGEYTVTWCYGHLMMLREPESYDAKYKKWTLADLPINFENWELVPTVTRQWDNSSKSFKTVDHTARVNQIKSLIDKADVVIHAGDMDDEGEQLVLELLEYSHCSKPIYRLSTNDNTKSIMEKALENITPYSQENRNIAAAAYSRAVADYFAGINYSRLLSLKLQQKGMSVGRVQSPTLGLVVNRDIAIQHHVKEKYYTLFAETDKDITLKFSPSKDFLSEHGDGKYIKEPAVLETVGNSLSTVNMTVKHQEVIKKPELVFNLLKLQVYMNNKYKWPLQKTDAVTQSLRDKHKAITYNRSDCQYLAEEHYAAAPKLLPVVMQRLNVDYPLDYSIHSDCFNENEVTAHHGIIPTGQDFSLSNLSEDEKLCYIAICERYMQQFLPAQISDKTTATVDIEQGTLSASSSVIVDKGFTAFFGNTSGNEDEEKEVSALSQLADAEYEANILHTNISENETKPLKKYTAASLAVDMCSISKYVKDPEIKKILVAKDKGKKGEHGSIGTPATRSSIISGLIRKGYLTENKNNIESTPLGREYYAKLPDDIKTADCTAKWWSIIEDIKTGSAQPADLINNISSDFTKHLNDDYGVLESANNSLGKCPICGKPITETPKAYSCCGGRDGCGFVVWKTICSKNISATQVKKLIETGKSDLIKGFVSKSNKKFDAFLVITEKDGKKVAGFEFNNK